MKNETSAEARCTECGWTGKPPEVEWGIWIPPSMESFNYEPERCNCPECGSEVEIHL